MDLNLEEIFAWARQNVEVLIAVLSAFVAAFSAYWSTRETRKQRKLQVETLRQRIDGASIAWGNEAIDLLGEAGSVADMCRTPVPNDAIDEAKMDVARRISSLVDRGRLFFPNVNPSSKGAEKEGAYRGHRPPVLDALMYAFYEVQEISRGSGPAHKTRQITFSIAVAYSFLSFRPILIRAAVTRLLIAIIISARPAVMTRCCVLDGLASHWMRVVRVC